MAIGKYLSLEEARKANKLERFAKEHPHKGDWQQFDRMLDAMVRPKKPKEGDKTSTQE